MNPTKSNIHSLRWYLKEEDSPPTSPSDPSSAASPPPSRLLSAAVAASHVLLSGVIWRYGKLLFAPVDVAVVKREMRNLSILREEEGIIHILRPLKIMIN